MKRKNESRKNRILVCAVKGLNGEDAQRNLKLVEKAVCDKLCLTGTGCQEVFTFDERSVVQAMCGVSGRRARRILSRIFPGQDISVEEKTESGRVTVYGDKNVFRGPYYAVVFGFVDDLDDSTMFVSRDLLRARHFYDDKIKENLKLDYNADGISWEKPEYKEEDFGHFYSFATQSGISRVGSVDFRLLRVGNL